MRVRRDGRPLSPYLALLRMGFTVPPPLPAGRCALTAPFHPCRPFGRRFVFCGTFLRVAATGDYPACRPYGVRTFLPDFSGRSRGPLGAAIRVNTGRGLASVAVATRPRSTASTPRRRPCRPRRGRRPPARRAEAREELVRARDLRAGVAARGARARGRPSRRPLRPARARARPRGRSRRPRCRPRGRGRVRLPSDAARSPAGPSKKIVAFARVWRSRPAISATRAARSSAEGRDGPAHAPDEVVPVQEVGHARRARLPLAPGLRERAPRMLEAEEQHRQRPPHAAPVEHEEDEQRAERRSR